MLGLAIGGTFLGVALAAVSTISRHLLPSAPASTIAAALVLLVLRAERRNGLDAMAGNFVVPEQWVVAADERVGLLWGLILGPGVLTQPPGAAFYGGCVAAALTTSPDVAILAGLAFAAGRAAVSIPRACRRSVLDSLESYQGKAGGPWALRMAERASQGATAVSALLLGVMPWVSG